MHLILFTIYTISQNFTFCINYNILNETSITPTQTQRSFIKVKHINTMSLTPLFSATLTFTFNKSFYTLTCLKFTFFHTAFLQKDKQT